MSDKYELIQSDVKPDMFRVKALKDFTNTRGAFIAKGSIGGHVSAYGILSQQGTCWIDTNATVIGGSIEDDAYVGGKATVTDTRMRKKSAVLGEAQVRRSILTDTCTVTDKALVEDECVIGGTSKVMGMAHIKCDVTLDGGCTMTDNAFLVGPITINSPITVKNNITTNFLDRLHIKFGAPDKDGYYTAYKLVVATEDSRIYESCFNANFKYDFTKTDMIQDLHVSLDSNRLCASGLHFTMDEDYQWNEEILSKGNIILTCKVHENDIISYDNYGSNKFRAKKAKVVKVRPYPLPKEWARLQIYHGLYSNHMISMVYNNKNYRPFYKYNLHMINDCNVVFELDIDPEIDSVDNYNIVLLSTKQNEDTMVLPPRSYKNYIVGSSENPKDTYGIEHNLNTNHIISTVFDVNNDQYKDVTKQVEIVYLSSNVLSVKFDHVLADNERYKIVITTPGKPLDLGSDSARGIVNAAPTYKSIVFMGSNVDKDSLSVTLDNPFDEEFDIIGAIYNHNLCHNRSDTILSRDTEKKKLIFTFGSLPLSNHQFVATIFKV